MMSISKRPGIKLIHSFPEGEVAVGIVEFKGTLIIATSNNVYRLIPETDQLEKVEIRYDEGHHA